MISVEAAARALCELFLANADRGDNTANDHLIAEMVGRIRNQQESERVPGALRVRFDDNQVISLRPHLVRVLEETPDGNQGFR